MTPLSARVVCLLCRGRLRVWRVGDPLSVPCWMCGMRGWMNRTTAAYVLAAAQRRLQIATIVWGPEYTKGLHPGAWN